MIRATGRTAYLTLLLASSAACGAGGGAAPPRGPSSLDATAGDGQVVVTWSEAPGATSYNLYVTALPFQNPREGTRLVGVTSPYVHGGLPGGQPPSPGTPGSLTNGTTYCYLVTAVNGAGESSEGNLKACAQPVFPVARLGVGRELLVLSEMPEGTHDIHVYDEETRALVNLTRTPDVDEGGPAWSPDGERIAFHSDRDGGGLYIMDGDGSNLVRVSNQGLDPAWAPDGSRLAVLVGGGIHTMLPDGTDLRQVTDGTLVTDRNPAWSPDGSQIAFDSTSPISGVFLVRPDGTERRQVRTGNTPAWSHDGLQIAYICRVGIGLGSLNVCVDDLDGPPRGSFGGGSTPGNPSWSADGRIAFDTSPAGGGQGAVLVAFPNPQPPVYFVEGLLASASRPRWRPRISAIPGPGQVTIRWAPSTAATSYNLYFGPSPGVTTSSGTRLEGVASPFVHQGLAGGSTYHYVVTAVNSGRETVASPEVFATVPVSP